MRTRAALLAIIVVSTLTFAQKNSVAKEFLGMWDASLNNSTEEVPFKLEIKNDKGKLSATVWNGPEPWPFTSAKFENGILTLRFEQYDGTLHAKLENGKLVGDYFRPYAKGIVHYPLPSGSAQSDVFLVSKAGNKPLRWIYRLITDRGQVGEKGVMQLHHFIATQATSRDCHFDSGQW